MRNGFSFLLFVNLSLFPALGLWTYGINLFAEGSFGNLLYLQRKGSFIRTKQQDCSPVYFLAKEKEEAPQESSNDINNIQLETF